MIGHVVECPSVCSLLDVRLLHLNGLLLLLLSSIVLLDCLSLSIRLRLQLVWSVLPIRLGLPYARHGSRYFLHLLWLRCVLDLPLLLCLPLPRCVIVRVCGRLLLLLGLVCVCLHLRRRHTLRVRWLRVPSLPRMRLCQSCQR